MSDVPTTYDPTKRFVNTNGLFNNHFKFHIEALPDLTFFTQSVTLPSITTATVRRQTPFAEIRETGDHLNYAGLVISFKVDAGIKNYMSLFWWLKGYGFPHSYEEVYIFQERRRTELAHTFPVVRDLEKTNAILQVLQPDTDSIMAEFRFFDIFPTALGELPFTTTAGDTEELKCTATFDYTTFDLFLP